MDNDDRFSPIPPFPQKSKDVFLRHGIHPFERLVKEVDFSLFRQRTGKKYTLLLAAGQFI